MKLADLTEEVKTVLTKERFDHSVRVLDTAKKLANHYEVPAHDVEIAATFYDYSKCFSIESLGEYIVYDEIDRTLLKYHHELWHGPVAAEMLRDKFQITNPDIYRAIYYHTTGRAEMSLLEYIVFFSDFTDTNSNI